MPRKELTARTRNGITSIMIRVDFTPRALKNPTDPRTESMTSTTPDRPSSTWKQPSHDFNDNQINHQNNRNLHRQKIYYVVY